MKKIKCFIFYLNVLFFALNCFLGSINNSKADEDTCKRGHEQEGLRYLLYNINYGEGFNLRRDVYLRVANLIRNINDKESWILVLPPWGDLYHWRNTPRNIFFPWRTFFDIKSLQKWIPVIEFDEFFKDKRHLDSAFTLQHYEDMWDREWIERYNLSECIDNHSFWKNDDGKWYSLLWNQELTFSQFSCLSFQGRADTIIPFLIKDQYSSVSVFLDHAEILMHDNFGSFEYWAARRSMRFATHLISEANNYRKTFIDSDDVRDKTKMSEDWRDFRPEEGAALGGPYVCAHLRRRDFIYARKDEVPSIEESAKQLRKILKDLKLKNLFVATDAPVNEINELRTHLKDFKVHHFSPTEDFLLNYGDGGAAIVDQIICSRARFFIGSYESTFSFRIQEEREILGFASDTTFNRLCGKNSECQPPTNWKIVYD
ncbi:GDP-fucose protein O-fucosyltransferase 2 [Armadillidium nasatum]|uniref:GDP-fucose protein O-fucosyltransferase 2 n=1 Tax=Armadillidium nasatum TaxID=96803 RepID=A0A5N5TM00_9CRUS|nr:GDP-fucose protein O-fucosyltransferase 2 [Armadillidium nasatum]